MADAAAKREARRRKILENSEYRLQKITGQAHDKQQPVERIKKAIGSSEVTSSNYSTPTANGLFDREPIIQSQSVDSLIDELDADIDAEESIASPSLYGGAHDIFTLLSTGNVAHRRNTGRSNASGQNGDTSKLNTPNNISFSQESRGLLGDSLLDNASTDNRNIHTDQKLYSINSILSSRFIYVALATILNIMVILKLEHLFGMSIIVPFIVIMIGRVCACKNDETSQGSNMLEAALILSNVRPDLVKVIHRLKGSLSLSGKILRDFAVYMFTFVLIHTALHRYCNNLDDTLTFPNEVQEIFDSTKSVSK